MPAKNRKGDSKRKTVENGTKKSSVRRKNVGLMDKILQFDEKWTSYFAVCANRDSTLSLFRPVMKLLEISCHGIPWLFFTTLLLLSVHQARHVEVLVNLLYGA